MKSLIFTTSLLTLLSPPLLSQTQSAIEPTTKKTNIIYFLCDDLGIGELGCYGQEKIKTPNIDLLAKEGMLFTQHYAGSAVSAPSRCTLLTGKHTGHSWIRGNREIKDAGQAPIPENSQTIASLLKTQGYATACIGKWGLGGVGTSGDPLKQGFDHFYGYNCQRHAHSYYPSFLWNDDHKVIINDGKDISGHGNLPKNADPLNEKSYERFIGKDWTPDLMTQDMVKWIHTNAHTPFFLYYATPLPHVALQAPPERVKAYTNQLGQEDPDARGGGYLPCRYPRATYAAMVSKIDEDLGIIMKTLKDLGIDKNTIIMFCSDNGPTFNGGTQSGYFKSAQGRRGLKCSVFEGGIRVPFIVRWPEQIQAGSTSDHLSAMWDFYATVCDLIGVKNPTNNDSISFLPTLFKKNNEQVKHDYLYWENHERNTLVQAIRQGDYKMVRNFQPGKPLLFNIKEDPQEKNNLAEKMPEKVEELKNKIRLIRTESELFPTKQFSL